MAETLDTLGEKIAALTTSLDKRFDQVDQRIDQQGSSLRIVIEAVDSKVDLVLETVTHPMQHRPPQDSPDAGERGGS